jgi:hypothetical protein
MTTIILAVEDDRDRYEAEKSDMQHRLVNTVVLGVNDLDMDHITGNDRNALVEAYYALNEKLWCR